MSGLIICKPSLIDVSIKPYLGYVKFLLEACGSIHDQQQNIIFTIHARVNFSAYTYTLQEETPCKSEDG